MIMADLRNWKSDSRALVNDNDLRQQLVETQARLASVEKKCQELEARLRGIRNLTDL